MSLFDRAASASQSRNAARQNVTEQIPVSAGTLFERAMSGGNAPAPVAGEREFSGDYLPGFSGLGFELQSLVSDDMDALARQYAPNAEFSKDAQGNPLIMFPEGGEGLWKNAKPGEWMYLNKPGVSGRDIYQAAGAGAAFLPAGAAGLTMLRYGAAPLAAAVTSGGLAAATQHGMDWLGNQMGTNEPPSIQRDTEAALWQAIPDFGMASVTRRAPGAGLPPSARPRAEQTANAARALDVDLSRGQLTGIPAGLERTKTLAQLPETSYEMTDFFRRQNDQAMRATRDVTDALTPSNVPPGAMPYDYAQRRAQNAVNEAQEARRAAGGPVYERAVHQNPMEIDTNALVGDLESAAQGYAPGTPMRRAIQRVQGWLGGERVIGPDGFQAPSNLLSVEQAHNIQGELMDMAEAARRAGNNDRARVLGQTRDEVVQYIQDVSPEYEEARQIWRDLSRPVEELQGSVVGRLANAQPHTVEALADRVFNPHSRTAQAARAHLRQHIGPDTYNSLMREFIDKQIGKIQDIGTAEVQNLPNQLNRALFKNQPMRDMLVEFATPEQREAVQNLSRVLDAAASGRHPGSPTATRQQVVEALTSKLPDTLFGLTRRLLGGVNETVPKFIKNRRTQRIREQALRDELPGGDMIDRIMRDYAGDPGVTRPGVGMALQSYRERNDATPATDALGWLGRQFF